jgi:hypothetical protein
MATKNKQAKQMPLIECTAPGGPDRQRLLLALGEFLTALGSGASEPSIKLQDVTVIGSPFAQLKPAWSKRMKPARR